MIERVSDTCFELKKKSELRSLRFFSIFEIDQKCGRLLQIDAVALHFSVVY